uniref:beta-ketoacyl synthase N-terminal-like domain-containing protein n=1 Tax=Eshraghiella crossota TaxID=45851 RepID=UPI0040252409
CYAYNVVKTGDEKMMIATGLDENTDIMELLYDKLGLLSDKDEATPYAMDGRSFVLGEGATSIMLESEASANERGAKKLAEVAGYAMTHESVTVGTIKGSGAALCKAVLKACENAGITTDDIDAVVGFGNGNTNVDTIETESYEKVFGDKVKTLPVLSVKTLTGEARACSAALSVAHAAMILSGELDSTQPAYNFVNGKAVKTTTDTKNFKYILVTSYAAGGSYTAVVLKKVQ